MKLRNRVAAWATLPAIFLTAVPVLAQAPAPADPGATVYRQRCQQCHGPAGAGSALGPKLVGVSGRAAATGKFAYTPAMKASKLTWDKPTLDRYLAGPTKAVPGTRMIVGLPDATQRAAVIAYLATLR
jgi:cytochrome c